MKWRDLFKQSMDERLYNYTMYYYLHLKRGQIPKKLNLKNPKTFNEKIIWLKIHHRYNNAHILTDKVLVKDFVSQAIGDKYVIPNIVVYDCVEQIDFACLPDSFVLKANHGSGWNIICNNKSALDIQETKRKLNEWLRTNYYTTGKEYQYRDIEPKILCEIYLENSPEDPLIDYKIFCFSGNPLFIQVDLDRLTNHSRNFYNLNWELMPFTTLYPLGKKILPKPDSLDEMLTIARRLSQGLVFSRIDLYFYKKRVFFGEITLGHGGGFEPFIPRKYDLILGQHVNLPAKETAHSDSNISPRELKANH